MAEENCDTCGGEVTTKNCAITMHCIAWDQPYIGLFARRRCIRCSPSRAQHIVHPDFPPVVDCREQYDKRLFESDEQRHMFERRWTAAWLVCQNEEVADAVLGKLAATWEEPE